MRSTPYLLYLFSDSSPGVCINCCRILCHIPCCCCLCIKAAWTFSHSNGLSQFRDFSLSSHHHSSHYLVPKIPSLLSGLPPNEVILQWAPSWDLGERRWQMTRQRASLTPLRSLFLLTTFYVVLTPNTMPNGRQIANGRQIGTLHLHGFLFPSQLSPHYLHTSVCHLVNGL